MCSGLHTHFKMKKNVAFLVLILFTSMNSNGQDQLPIDVRMFQNSAHYFPPSPEAASLARYAEIPLNKQTGIPAINVPIYQWKSSHGNAQLNINLSYHAGGIKVEDVASSYGCGWTLNASGVITRMIRGLPDESARGFLNTPIIPDYNTWANFNAYYENTSAISNELATNPSPDFILAYFNNGNNDDEIMEEYSNGKMDSEQDLFYYNVDGLSGQFVVDKNGTVNKLDQNDLVITANITTQANDIKDFSSFTIQNDNGLLYTFDVPEISSYQPAIETNTNTCFQNQLAGTNACASWEYMFHQPPISSAVSSFFLSSISDLNSQDVIQFNYSDKTIAYVGGYNESVEYLDLPIQGAGSNNNTPAKQLISKTYYTIEAKQLSSIQFPDGVTVNFSFLTDRVDLQGDKELDRIEISAPDGSSRKYKLSYEYFDGSATVVNPDVTLWREYFGAVPGRTYIAQPDHFYKRLKLKSIHQVQDWSETDGILVAKFDYNALELPPRFSKSIDFWGYFRGLDPLTGTIIPSFRNLAIADNTTEGLQTSEWQDDPWNGFADGVDRRPDATYAQAGVLKKISLLTGGYTEFEYELNEVKDPIYINYQVKDEQLTGYDQAPNPVNVIPFENRNFSGALFFVKFKRVNADGSDYAAPVGGGPSNCINGMVASTSFTLEVSNLSGSMSKQYSFQAIEEGESMVRIYYDLPLEENYSFNLTYNPGNGECYENVYFKTEVAVRYQVANPHIYVGGVRVSKIKYNDPVSGNSFQIVYDYKGEDGFSSGVIPIVHQMNISRRTWGIWTCCVCDPQTQIPEFLGYNHFEARTSTSTQTLGYGMPSNVGYTRVTESRQNLSGERLGKSVYAYSGFNVVGLQPAYPYTPVQIIGWTSGSPLKTLIYDEQDNLIKQTDYSYQKFGDELNNDLNRSIKISAVRGDMCAPETNPIPFLRYVSHSYYPYYGKIHLTGKTEKTFIAGTSQFRQDEFEYYYFGQTDHIKTIKWKENGKGDSKQTTYYYPSDFKNAGTDLLAQNKVNGLPVAIRESLYNNADLLAPPREINGEGADYAVNGNYAQTQTFSRLASAEPLIDPEFDNSQVRQPSDRVTGQILTRDSYENICEYEGVDGIPICTIWGYNGTKPILKIAGASYADVLDYLTTASISLSQLESEFDASQIRAAANQLRNAFIQNTKVQVTAYTYNLLAGLDSETDPLGKVTYYEYDGYLRLTRIRDDEQNVTKQFEYHYRQP